MSQSQIFQKTMGLSYNLAYQEIISVHLTRRQIFAGKLLYFLEHLRMSHILYHIHHCHNHDHHHHPHITPVKMPCPASIISEKISLLIPI